MDKETFFSKVEQNAERFQWESVNTDAGIRMKSTEQNDVVFSISEFGEFFLDGVFIANFRDRGLALFTKIGELQYDKRQKTKSELFSQFLGE